ncbi:MAG: pyridoxamine 5'-phosphate oxidase family protein [Halioglobus sp.]|nr:pyridoxamine 5'-phosphate oxidase family protein [marine gamma proteobacterium HTCC2148]MDG1387556.1 pyridoxamine 5'-phosphate oxidase family protein [Halioglobus sp.]MDG2327417.1 pyridoxamine 5'-phosphate oxidase family protein [Halioglobus sp.]
MANVDPGKEDEFFMEVDAAAKKAVWCALATIRNNAPRVRMVHPTWEGKVLWIATGVETAKAKEIQKNAAVDIQFQVAPDDFVHLMVRGTAEVKVDSATKNRVWEVLDYDLTQFWPDGPANESYCLIRVEPFRVELSEMFGSRNKRVWRSPSDYS